MAEPQIKVESRVVREARARVEARLAAKDRVRAFLDLFDQRAAAATLVDPDVIVGIGTADGVIELLASDLRGALELGPKR